MTPEFAIDLIRALMWKAVLIASPVLFTAMAIGLSVSLFQTVTSIQEQTLTFVPKALGVVVVLVIALPWILRTLVEFTILVISLMPQMVR
ncbi:MAG: flagellar biosynthetic protein FliQ [Limisphaerales bacterium]|jgi:flagellar biosynthetic protein FliQ